LEAKSEPAVSTPATSVPAQAWVVTFAGTTVNLCLGILYAWSVWKANLIASAAHPAGSAMTGINAGWTYLTDAEATWAYAICGVVFSIAMIPGGKLQDKCGPRIGVTLSGLLLGSGCFLAGYLQSYTGLILGFGLLGGIGMGLGYSATTPAAVKWFGPQQRGLIVGLVVGGYGGAAIYIGPLAKYLIAEFGLTGSFYGLGAAFALVILIAAQLLALPPAGYVPPAPKNGMPARSNVTREDWSAREVLRTWQFYALMFLFIGSCQSGLLVIGNAAPMLSATAGAIPFFAANAWLLASYGGLVNASGRIGTGSYSDHLGRTRAYLINGLLSVACLFATPSIMQMQNVALLFLVVGIVYWQYGGGLALTPALTADYFGGKNLGLNYGLVFLGFGVAFFIPQFAGYIKDWTGSLDNAFYLSGGVLLAAVILSQFLTRPHKATAHSGP